MKKTMTRQEIKDRINNLKKEIIDLQKEEIMLCDDKQQYVEKIESHPKAKGQRKPNELDGKLVGRIHWKDSFTDEDTNEKIEIERTQIVKIDGDWLYWNGELAGIRY